MPRPLLLKWLIGFCVLNWAGIASASEFGLEVEPPALPLGLPSPPRRRLDAAPSPPPPSPKPACATLIDFVLVLDESGSMTKPKPDGSMEGPGGLKALAKMLVSQFALGVNAARFSVVSFASDATIRVSWSYDYASINAGIDEMTAYGRTSISDGFEAAGQLFDGGREGVSKFVLFISDGDQTVDAAPGKSLRQTSIDAATLVKEDGVTVFAWGIGKANLMTLQEIATDPSTAIVVEDIGTLGDYGFKLLSALCNESPPPN